MPGLEARRTQLRDRQAGYLVGVWLPFASLRGLPLVGGCRGADDLLSCAASSGAELRVGDSAVNGAPEPHVSIMGSLYASLGPEGADIGRTGLTYGGGLPVVTVTVDALLEISEPGLRGDLCSVEVEDIRAFAERLITACARLIPKASDPASRRSLRQLAQAEMPVARKFVPVRLPPDRQSISAPLGVDS